MRHLIIGGDGFVGHQLACDLEAMGEKVVIADIAKSPHAIYSRVPHVFIDVTKRETLNALEVAPDDMIYNLSAKMLSPIMPRAKRHDFFYPVNCHGVANILDWMTTTGNRRLVHFMTDMVYGHALKSPVTEDHRAEPLGEYGMSKLDSEALCHKYREKGFSISIFRPRLIIGPGRLGILSKLFKLVDANLPIPMIGGGHNAYQFISVYDCASAARLAWQGGVPNAVYNLGSDEPPPVRELLGKLVAEAGSSSFLLPTPAPLVKFALNTLDFVNLPLMDPEQYLIADEHCVLDTSALKRDLGWVPQHRDEDMLIAAYRPYRATKAGPAPAQQSSFA